MTSLAPIVGDAGSLPALVDRAAATLANARTSAEVLEARDMASLAYDAAKRAARLQKAKGAHDALIAATHRAQADALEIEAQAKRRLADEYDAAQERGEVARIGDNLPSVPKENSKPTAADVGLSRKDIHEARIIRDAETAQPGVVRAAVDEALAKGDEPTRAAVKRAALRVVHRDEERPSPPRLARGRESVCYRVREALTTLSGLPPAAEVATYFRGSDAAIVVDDHLISAARWIAEFYDAWKEAGNAGAGQ